MGVQPSSLPTSQAPMAPSRVGIFPVKFLWVRVRFELQTNKSSSANHQD